MESGRQRGWKTGRVRDRKWEGGRETEEERNQRVGQTRQRDRLADTKG